MERANKFKGEEEFLGRGVSYCGVCDAAFFQDQPVAVIGEDDYGVEEAEFIARFASKVYFVVPGSRIKAPPEILEEFEKLSNVDILLRHRVVEITGDKVVKGIKLKDVGRQEEKFLEVSGVFIFLGGTKPSVDFLMGQVELKYKAGCYSCRGRLQSRTRGGQVHKQEGKADLPVVGRFSHPHSLLGIGKPGFHSLILCPFHTDLVGSLCGVYVLLYKLQLLLELPLYSRVKGGCSS